MKGPMLAIDPGLRACGCAYFVDGRLSRAELVKNPEKKARGPGAHHQMANAVGQWIFTLRPSTRIALVLEYPRIYPKASQQKGDPNDLLELAGVDGALVSWIIPDTVQHYFPAEWKGQVPKPIMLERIRAKLTSIERGNCYSQDHNTFDGIGIGLYFLGRTKIGAGT